MAESGMGARPDAARVVTDTLFIFIGDAVARLANGLLYVFVGRILGPGPAGSFNLGLTYALLLGQIAFWGLDQILTREVARRPDEADRYFGNFLSVRVLLPTLLYGGLIALLAVARPYPAGVERIILILGITIVTDNITNLCGALLMGLERMRLFSLLNIATTVPRFAIGLALLYSGAGLFPIALTVAATAVGGMLLNLLAVRRLGVRIRPAAEWGFWLRHLRIALPFVLIVIFYQIEYQMDTVLISLFHDAREVGFYGAVTFIMTGLMLIPGAYRSAIYPLMSRLVTADEPALIRLLHRSVRTLLTLTLPIALALSFLAGPVIELVYRSDFLPAAPALAVIVWSFVLLAINMPLARLMIAADRQGAVAWMLALSMAVNLATNLLLIPRLGALGAAIARVGSVTLYVLLMAGWTRRHYPAFRMLPLMGRPLLAALPALGLLGVLGATRPWLALVAGLTVYLVAAWWLGAITPEDRRLLAESVRRLRAGAPAIPDTGGPR